MKTEQISISKTFTKSGKTYKLNIPLPLKIIMIVLISNCLFYMLFFPTSTQPLEQVRDESQVEIRIEARLLTPFQNGKKVTLHHQGTQKLVPALLVSPPDEEGLITISTDVNLAQFLIKQDGWQIIPLIAMGSESKKGEDREIRY